jgi:hypothetical protein
MLCPKCNQITPDGTKYCANCGQAMSAVDNPGATVIRPASSHPGADAPAGGGAAAWAANRLPGLFERVKNILLTPKTEWPIIEAEATSISQLYMGYVVPLAAFAALVSFVRMSLIGINLGLGVAFRTPFANGLVYAVVRFGASLLGLFLAALIIDALAPTFSSTRNQRQALKTAAYAFTPAWLGSVLVLLPGLGGLLALAAALYGIYLLYLGLPVLMRGPRDKSAGYTAAVVICTVLMGAVLGILMSVTGVFGGYGGLGAVRY